MNLFVIFLEIQIFVVFVSFQSNSVNFSEPSSAKSVVVIAQCFRFSHELNSLLLLITDDSV